MLLADIIGHAATIDALRSAFHNERVHHAYLLAGPAGIGKRQLAVGFAALVNCTGPAPTDGEGRRTDACGECRTCRGFLADSSEARHPDLCVLEPDGRQIKIAQVRDILRMAAFPPLEAAYRFIVIDPADSLGDEAANALLKTLEEPRDRTRFMLVTSQPDALLITIQSRCQRVGLRRLSDAQVGQVLVSRGVEPEDIARVVPVAQGSVGGAIALLEDPVLSQQDTIAATLAGIEPGDVGAAFALATQLGEVKSARPTLFAILRRLYRDALLVRVGATDVVRGLPHSAAAADAIAARYNAEALMLRLDLIEQTAEEMARVNLNPRVGFERLCVSLTAAPGREAVPTDAGRHRAKRARSGR